MVRSTFSFDVSDLVKHNNYQNIADVTVRVHMLHAHKVSGFEMK